MDIAKLELAAQRYRDAEEALEAARLDLQAEAVAALEREDVQPGDESEVGRVTGWSPGHLRRLMESAQGQTMV